ncbi:hypothetical protein [Aquiflexum sp.]|uniref:hypothetical protein n=1 Tax=Aquiflexum sp. TaxID=1872584 RepID=UPI003593F96C
MNKTKKESPNHNNGVLSKLNDNPDQNEKDKIGPADKKKGVISKLNDDPDQKK